jgi:hypothetical protein
MISNFFLFCAGADPKIIEKCPASERTKYVTLGLIVSLTACAAVFSSAYALTRVFVRGGMYIVMPVATLFGLFVFGIDRLMLVTWKPQGRPSDFVRAIPRLVMAALVALVIAKPLEIRIVEDRIGRTLEDRKQAALAKDVDHQNNFAGLNTATARVENEQNELRKLDARQGSDPPGELFKAAARDSERCSGQLTAADQRLQRDAPALERRIAELAALVNDASANEPNPGLQAAYAGVQAQLASLRDAVARKRTECERLDGIVNAQRREYAAATAAERQRHATALAGEQRERTTAQASAQREIAKDAEINDTAFGSNLISELEALGDLSASSSTIWWINLMITLMFISIDTAPVFMKLMAGRGPYDQICEAEEVVASARHAALTKFYTDKNRFAEMLEQEHQASVVERAMSEYVQTAVRFIHRIQQMGNEFETVVKNVIRSAARSGAKAEETSAFVTRLRESFVGIRQTSLGKFLREMRERIVDFGSPGRSSSRFEDERQHEESQSLH